MSRVLRVPCGDVNCHLIQGEQGAVLVDTGRSGYGEKLLPLCQRWDVRLIVLTHGHVDHAQNAAFLAGELGVPVAMHRLDAPLPGRRCAWSPARRMAELCRASGVPLGLVSNGRQFMLVHACQNKTSTFVTWDADIWLEERITVRSFVTLLHRRRFFSLTEEQTLPRLLEKSADAQQSVTDKLGLQVREAITEFLRALDHQFLGLGRRNSANLCPALPPAHGAGAACAPAVGGKSYCGRTQKILVALRTRCQGPLSCAGPGRRLSQASPWLAVLPAAATGAGYQRCF